MPQSTLASGSDVALHRVSKHFGDRAVFHSLDLEISAGEFVSLVGPSGCGKSTLLRLIAGLELPSGGEIAVHPVPRAAFVFQEAHLLPWRTVEQNVALPLELGKTPAAERNGRVARALEQVGMGREGALYPSQLSGGMKMRVSLARALVTAPTLLLLDEPFAALDELSRVQLEEELRSWWKTSGVTIVFVTHSFSEAVFLSERVVLLSTVRRGIGAIMQVGLGERNEALRVSSEFSRTVHECRTRFESIVKGIS
jgi:NitT/TauT family transport system ATP-binding protein